MVQKDFPTLVPIKREIKEPQGGSTYSLANLRGYLSMIIARIESEINEPSEDPIIEKREFLFVQDSGLRRILERDYNEIQRAHKAKCWKSVIILCGGTIEAILTDVLLQNETTAINANSAPKTNDITRWDLSKLIDVSVELQLVSVGIQKLSHPLREYRNLVHPSNEIRNNLKFSAEESRIAIECLHILHRDLSS